MGRCSYISSLCCVWSWGLKDSYKDDNWLIATFLKDILNIQRIFHFNYVKSFWNWNWENVCWDLCYITESQNTEESILEFLMTIVVKRLFFFWRDYSSDTLVRGMTVLKILCYFRLKIFSLRSDVQKDLDTVRQKSRAGTSLISGRCGMTIHLDLESSLHFCFSRAT